MKGLSAEFEPVVVCPSEGGLTDELRKAGVKTFCIPLYQWRKGKYFVHRYFSVRRLGRLVRELSPDIIHCNEFYAMPYAVKSTRGLGIPIVTHIRLNVNKNYIKKYFLDKADKLIVVSRALASKLADTELSERTVVVYNAINPADFPINKDREMFRREIGVSATTVMVGQVGGIEPRKRQHITLKAVRKVVDRFPDIHFVFIGNPRPEHQAYYKELHTIAKNLGIADKVSFIPFRTDIVEVYASLDINLLVSADEGFGRTIIEAGYLGVPSIGTHSGGIPELIEDGVTGCLVNLDDVDELSETILSLAQDMEKRRKMGESARRLVEQKFLLSTHCEKIQAIYKELLNR